MSAFQQVLRTLNQHVCAPPRRPDGGHAAAVALTGLELLLLRAQLWRDSAARHVSLDAPPTPLAVLAGHWRRLELAAWHALLPLQARWPLRGSSARSTRHRA